MQAAVSALPTLAHRFLNRRTYKCPTLSRRLFNPFCLAPHYHSLPILFNHASHARRFAVITVSPNTLSLETRHTAFSFNLCTPPPNRHSLLFLFPLLSNLRKNLRPFQNNLLTLLLPPHVRVIYIHYHTYYLKLRHVRNSLLYFLSLLFKSFFGKGRGFEIS